ncbi:MAG TPA: hemerythrin domain-containing protein [Polyangiales bacterium]|nr:hemerythrin domain-containing protein [Polyangiales bacterium]
MDAEHHKRQRSEVFRDAHREILQVIATMSTQLDPSKLARDASEARATLNMLAGKLTVHLAMEDKALYPRLAGHTSPDVRKLAGRFADEMGGILFAFKEYLAHWPTPESVQADGARFKLETEQIFAALRARIAKEDNELFPKLDET